MKAAVALLYLRGLDATAACSVSLHSHSLLSGIHDGPILPDLQGKERKKYMTSLIQFPITHKGDILL